MDTPFPQTLGIEEEYLLVHKESGALANDPPEELLSECQRRYEGQVSPEFLRSQIEVGTTVCTSLQEARDPLQELRATIAEVAGVAPERIPADVDGVSLVPLLRGQTEHLQREALYWHYPHYPTDFPGFTPASAVRSG